MNDQANTGRGAAVAPGAALLDIIILVGTSGIAFLGERLARDWGLLPLGEDSTGVFAVLVGVATALILIFIRGQSLRQIGFRRPRRWWTVAIWVAGIVAVFVAAQMAVPLLLAPIFDLPKPDFSRYDSIAGNLPAALLMMALLPLTASIPRRSSIAGS